MREPGRIGQFLFSFFFDGFLGKRSLEAEGFFYTWLIHFVQDVFIFTFFAIRVITVA
nr:hypothetical protein [Candidatus Njordarchaeota archaeon]